MIASMRLAAIPVPVSPPASQKREDAAPAAKDSAAPVVEMRFSPPRENAAPARSSRESLGRPPSMMMMDSDAYEFEKLEMPGAFVSEDGLSGSDELTGPMLTEQSAREALAKDGLLSQRARMLKDFFSGQFVDGAGKPIQI